MPGERIYVYADSFCPPTYKDLRAVQLAADVCPWLTILCYRRPGQTDIWFSEEECAEMWQAYPLPLNVEVMTRDDFIARGLDPNRVTYVELRKARKHELRHVYLSPDKSQVTVFLEPALADMSSVQALGAAADLALLKLGKTVAPLIISRLLEKVLDIRSLHVVVGQPYGGKATVLELLFEGRAEEVVYIDSDEFNHMLRPALTAAFPDQDLSALALRMGRQFRNVVAKPWLSLLVRALRNVDPGKSVFVKVPYGLREQVQIYRVLGGKILYVGCGERLMHTARFGGGERAVRLRKFMEVIPDEKQTFAIAHREGLKVFSVDTDCPFNELREKVGALRRRLLP